MVPNVSPSMLVGARSRGAGRGSAAVAVAKYGNDRIGPWSAKPAAALTTLRDHSGVDAFPLRLSRDDTDHVIARIDDVPAEIGAVFLANADPAHASSPQEALRNLPDIPVVTDQETAAIALTAALLSGIGAAALRPRACRVVIVGADALPLLPLLLIAAGVVDIVRWTENDAEDFPLSQVVRNADVVIDVLGTAEVLPRSDLGSAPVVIGPGDVRLVLPLPGLLRAIVKRPSGVLCTDLSARTELYCACAYALSAATPPGRLFPDLADPVVTGGVAQAAAAVLNHL